MSELRSRLCTGEVVHRRYRPKRHQLRYKVLSVLVDLDELPAIERSCRLLSVNRFNLFSLHERDHGDGDARPLKSWVMAKVAAAGHTADIDKVLMLCFPRLLGYVFNPLTVYYCLDAGGEIAVMVYEVNNTFGGRHCYIVPVRQRPGGVIRQSADKQFYVSPFNEVAGQYGFAVTAPGERLTVGVSLRVDGAPLMNAYQTATTAPLTDAGLVRAFLRMPLMTFKVIAGIHFEAARLWLKGLRIVKRPRPSNGTTDTANARSYGTR